MNARDPRLSGKEPAGDPSGSRDLGRAAEQTGSTGPGTDVTTEQAGSHTGPGTDVAAEQTGSTGPEADVTAEQAGELAERIARAVCGCPGVAGLARGPLATHLAGRAVRGVSVLEREVRVAVVADYGS